MPTTNQLKRPGNFHAFEKGMGSSPCFHGADHETRNVMETRHTKNNGGSWFAVAHNTESGHSKNPVSPPGANLSGLKIGDRDTFRESGVPSPHFTCGTKQAGLSGPEWFDKGAAAYPSRSNNRKAATAQISMIPFPLALHIGRCFLR